VDAAGHHSKELLVDFGSRSLNPYYGDPTTSASTEYAAILSSRRARSVVCNVLYPLSSKINLRGFLTSSLATAIAIVAGYQIISASRKTTRLRLGLTIIFLVDIILFIGGQTSALTFTSVSDDCTQRNILLTFADQFARISSLIVGLNIVSRGRSQLPKFALYAWFLGRLGTFHL
jgi:hypothetical protein